MIPSATSLVTLPLFLVDGLPLDQKDLPDVRKVEAGIERVAAPDTPCLDPPMHVLRSFDEIRLFPILEQQRDVGLERRLIAFDGEVVMRPALHQIRGQFALRQQGIGGDVFAPDSDALQQRGEHSDFIGLLGIGAARYGQCADFFG